MEFSIDRSVEVLRNTPEMLEVWLGDLSEGWKYANEGKDTFSAFDVLGHLIHGEKTDWIIRLDMILEGGKYSFPPYDRFAQYEESKGKSMNELLSEFKMLRSANLEYLMSLDLDEHDLEMPGKHPSLGKVNMRNLIATWVVHDLSHIGQIARVMAKVYSNEVGPWKEYLPILTRH